MNRVTYAMGDAYCQSTSMTHVTPTTGGSKAAGHVCNRINLTKT